jgi:acyl-coenzyme A synthetase/AMP-(fatty) acid ligase
MKMRETFTAEQIKNKFNLNDEIDNDSKYFISETSGSDGDKKTIFIKAKHVETTFKALFKKIDYNGENVIVTTPSDHMFAACLGLACDNLYSSFEINDLVKKINENKVKYIFSVPSFIWNFKEFLNFNDNQILLLTGEVVSENLYEYLKNKNIKCYHFFGANECNLIGLKRIEDEYYDFLIDDITIKDNCLYSPYLASGFIKDNIYNSIKNVFSLNDVFEVIENKFKFISRVSAYAKINGNSVSISEINKFLNTLKNINDFIVFKTNNEDELDELALIYVGEINENEIKNTLLSHFNNFSYLPAKIKKIDSFPLTNLGKKNILVLREWMKQK